MKIDFVEPGRASAEGAVLALSVFEDEDVSQTMESIDQELSDATKRAIGLGRYKGKLGDCLEVLAPPRVAFERILVVGAGARDLWGARNAEQSAAYAYNKVKNSGAGIMVLRQNEGSPELAAHAALGIRLAAYRFDRYRTKENTDDKPSIEAVRIEARDPKAAAAACRSLDSLADAICLARDLVSEPANVLYPAEFARRVKELSRIGLKVEILGEAEMRDLGMGALLGVGQGSVRESQLAILQWSGTGQSVPPLAFVGKGVCFDTGGVNLKPGERMEEMVIDMAGAAAVTGAMYALAARKARVNAVGILGLVENMPDGNAQRPGDVVKTMSGQTVEVINTDAEGRLVLADAIWYCQSRFKPRLIVDLATLTGAIITALGTETGGLFCNDETLAKNLLDVSAESGDRLWRMPLPPEHERVLDSRLADMKNVGERAGGAISAALFLKRFVKDIPWAHLDVGMAVWNSKSRNPTAPDGATGFGVRLLDQLVSTCYES